MVDIDELERLLAAATPGDLSTAERHVLSEYVECPMCGGDGEVGATDYCNFDGVALGVQFYGIGHEFGAHEKLWVAARNSLPAILTKIRELRAENARLRMANRSLRRGLYGLTDSGDADEIATTLEAGGVVDWDKYPPNARAALGEPQ